MITKLTKKQQELIPIIRNKWLNLNRPFDKKKCEKGINWLYEMARLSKPKILYFDSPMGIQLGLNMIGAVNNQIRSQIQNQINNQIKNQIQDQVYNQVGNQIRGQVYNQVGNQIRGQVYNQVGNQIRGQVDNQVRSQVQDQVISTGLKYFPFAFYGNVGDYGRLSYYDYFQKIGIVDHKLLSQYIEFIESGIYNCVQLDGLCVVCGMPTILLRDDKHRLHNTDGYAIQRADGYGQYYLHGIHFTEEEYNVFKKGDIKEIINWGNQDQKRAMLMEIEYSKMLSELNAKVIDESIDNDNNTMKLYEVDLGDDEQPGLFYEAIDPSKDEPVILRVAPNVGIKTALEAKIWTWKHLRDWVKEQEGNIVTFIKET